MRLLGYGVFKNNVLATYHGAWAVFPDKLQALECIGNMGQVKGFNADDYCVNMLCLTDNKNEIITAMTERIKNKQE